MALTDQLISYWRMDEASGTRADVHGTNNLTQVGTVGSGAGIISASAADFPGTAGNNLVHASNSDLQTGTDFEIMTWINMDTQATNVVCGKWVASGEWILYYTGGVLNFLIEAAAGVVNSGTTISAATWYMVNFWADLTNDSIGIAINADTTPDAVGYGGVITPTADPLHIGFSDDSSNWFDGRIGPMAYWKGRVLSTAERTTLYNGGAGLDYPFTGGVAQAQVWDLFPGASGAASWKVRPG